MTFLAIDIGNTRLKWALHTAPQRNAPLLAQGVEFLELDFVAQQLEPGLAHGQQRQRGAFEAGKQTLAASWVCHQKNTPAA